MDTVERCVISVYGPAGAGKSQLAKAVVARLGANRCARIPTDYFLSSGGGAETAIAPLAYDWHLLGRLLVLPDGAETSTPDVEFAALRRRADYGGPSVTARPIMLTDGFAPAPQSEASILLDAPAALRRDRIALRDQAWGTCVIARWPRLEATWAQVRAQAIVPDLALDGTEPIAANVDRVIQWFDAWRTR